MANRDGNDHSREHCYESGEHSSRLSPRPCGALFMKSCTVWFRQLISRMFGFRTRRPRNETTTTDRHKTMTTNSAHHKVVVRFIDLEPE